MAVHDMNPSEQYLVSLYLAVTTMTTVGYGDITPKTTAEVVYSIFLILQVGDQDCAESVCMPRVAGCSRQVTGSKFRRKI